MIPLGLLAVGEFAVIVGAGGVGGTRAEDLGLRPGKRVEMLTNGAGAVVVKVDESRIAVGRGVAMRIQVRAA